MKSNQGHTASEWKSQDLNLDSFPLHLSSSFCTADHVTLESPSESLRVYRWWNRNRRPGALLDSPAFCIPYAPLQWGQDPQDRWQSPCNPVKAGWGGGGPGATWGGFFNPTLFWMVTLVPGGRRGGPLSFRLCRCRRTELPGGWLSLYHMPSTPCGGSNHAPALFAVN